MENIPQPTPITLRDRLANFVGGHLLPGRFSPETERRTVVEIVKKRGFAGVNVVRSAESHRGHLGLQPPEDSELYDR